MSISVSMRNNVRAKDSSSTRWVVLVLLILGMAGCYVFMYVLSPLQIMLQDSCGWSPMAYGRYSSASSFLNVFCFFLIFAGIILDKMGVRYTAITASLIMLGGGFINYFALTQAFVDGTLYDQMERFMNLPDAWWNITPFCSGMPATAKLSALGYMIFGVGCEMAGISASRASVKWFMGKEMSLSMGIQLACSRFAVAFTFWISPRLADLGGLANVSRPVGFAVLLLMIGLVCFISYAFIDGRERNGKIKEEPFRMHDLKKLFTGKAFWIIAGICIFFYASVFPFQRYAIAMLQCSLGVDDRTASDLFTFFPIVAAVLMPPICYYVDRKGRATYILLGGAVLIFACHCIFAFVLPVVKSMVLASFGVGMLGLSVCLVSATLWPSVPRLVSPGILGSTYASLYWLQNVGLWSVPMLVAYVLQKSNVGMENPMDYSYTQTMIVFCILSAFTVMLSIIMILADRKGKWNLNQPIYKN